MDNPRFVVHSDPEILGGTPVFVGTRVPLRNLIDYLEGGHRLEELLDAFPSVSREQAVDALKAAHEALTARAVLLDEQLPRQLAQKLSGHDVRIVQQQGWAGLRNGELLQRAADAGFDVFLTDDRNLEFQQNVILPPEHHRSGGTKQYVGRSIAARIERHADSRGAPALPAR
jgi:uncharacterized protein (DUF433 family)